MRILYVVSRLNYGGAEKQVVELARQLAAGGHEVAIYTLNDDVPRERELAGSGVRLIVDQKRWKFDAAVLLRLRRTLMDWRPDIIHGFLFDGDFYSRVAAVGSGIPVLNSERNDNYRLTPGQSLAHYLTRRLARGVVANTHSGKAFAERLFGLPGDAVHVVWNGLRLEDLERHAAAAALDVRREYFGGADVRVACLVGNISPRKDWHLALDVADRLTRLDPRWRVLFIGDEILPPGSYRHGAHSDTRAYKAEVLRRYDELRLAGRASFAGMRTDAPALVRQCDALYVTSAHEGFPNVVLEAMGLEVPVVSTEYSDIRRILPFPEQVVSSRDPEQLARAVIAARERRPAIAARQKEWVRLHGTIEKAAVALEGVYRQYLSAGAQARAGERAA